MLLFACISTSIAYTGSACIYYTLIVTDRNYLYISA